MALTQQERINLETALDLLDLTGAAAEALRYSHSHSPELREDRDAYDDEDWEHWDAFTSRFARLADLLTQTVFRALDAVEFLPPESFLDRLNRAEKRGHIRSTTVWKEIREVRNQIAHEYARDKLLPLIRDVVKYTPELLACAERVGDHRLTLRPRMEKGE